MATLQEKIYEHEDFFVNKILYPMTKRKFDTLNQGARKRFIEAEENGVKDTSKLKEIQKLLATAPNWYETEFIDVDVKTFMDKCKKKFDNSYEEYMDDIKAFICQIYIEVSRNLWDNVELFTDSCSNAVKDKNQEKIKKIIADTVREQVKEFEVPKEMDKFEALTKLLDNDKEQRSDDEEQRSNYEEQRSDNEDTMFGGKTMRSDEDHDDIEEKVDNKESDEDREDKESDEDERDDDDDDNEGEQEDDDDESDDSVIEVDITPSKSKKEKRENDDEEDGEDREDDEEDHENDDNENDDEDDEEGDLFAKSEDEDEENDNNKKSFKMDKSKVMNIMEEAEKKLQNDPDLTDENIENFLKFKKFLEMTKKVKVENFEEVLQKALETPKETSEETPKETPKKQAPIPKPPRTRRKSAPKTPIVEPSFEEIVEEESLGLFDAPLKAPEPPQRRGKKK